ncbi:unnamed protein product [Arabidopsis lyrata]|nr:unnamed protein product [Arabidopsis lyrata]
MASSSSLSLSLTCFSSKVKEIIWSLIGQVSDVETKKITSIEIERHRERFDYSIESSFVYYNINDDDDFLNNASFAMLRFGMKLLLQHKKQRGHKINENDHIGKWRIMIVKDLPFTDQRLTFFSQVSY